MAVSMPWIAVVWHWVVAVVRTLHEVFESAFASVGIKSHLQDYKEAAQEARRLDRLEKLRVQGYLSSDDSLRDSDVATDYSSMDSEVEEEVAKQTRMEWLYSDDIDVKAALARRSVHHTSDPTSLSTQSS
eukprot:m.292138 g.292138  ORF g.292138 m.292138 type:complete len:130 (-) comp15835_c0_seq2:2595-2984(-)